MKKFTKLFLSCAAIAALTATVAVSAMAEEVPVNMTGTTATYDTEAGTLKFTAPEDMDTAKAATFVVFPNADGVDETALKDSDIVGIDQTDKGVGFDKAGLKGKPQAPAEDAETKVTYTVKLGYFNKDGQFTILKGTLFSAGLLMGDVNFVDGVNLDDATLIINHFVRPSTDGLTGDALKAAEVSGEDPVNLDDATCIINYFVRPSGTDHGVAGEVK